MIIKDEVTVSDDQLIGTFLHHINSALRLSGQDQPITHSSSQTKVEMQAFGQISNDPQAFAGILQGLFERLLITTPPDQYNEVRISVEDAWQAASRISKDGFESTIQRFKPFAQQLSFHLLQGPLKPKEFDVAILPDNPFRSVLDTLPKLGLNRLEIDTLTQFIVHHGLHHFNLLPQGIEMDQREADITKTLLSRIYDINSASVSNLTLRYFLNLFGKYWFSPLEMGEQDQFAILHGYSDDSKEKKQPSLSLHSWIFLHDPSYLDETVEKLIEVTNPASYQEKRWTIIVPGDESTKRKIESDLKRTHIAYLNKWQINRNIVVHSLQMPKLRTAGKFVSLRSQILRH